LIMTPGQGGERKMCPDGGWDKRGPAPALNGGE